MPEPPLDITVYFDEESPTLLTLVNELDDLEVAYDERRATEVPVGLLSELYSKAGTDLEFPVVTINDTVLVRPSAANVMSAIMHARSAGFYQ